MVLVFIFAPLDSYTLNVRDYLSECWDLIDNNQFFSCNENFKYLWLDFKCFVRNNIPRNEKATMPTHFKTFYVTRIPRFGNLKPVISSIRVDV